MTTTTRKRTDANRPQAKTAARKWFEYHYGACGTDPVLQQKLWETFQYGWRMARGCRPTTREGAKC